MEFKTRLSGFLAFQILLIIIFLSEATLDLFAPVFKTGFLHYNYIIYYLLGITWLLRIYRQIYSIIAGKPILTVNENYLYDFNDDITYDWKDVDNVYVIKKSFLMINLKNPSGYLDRIRNSFRRFIAKFWYKRRTKKTLFFIDMGIVEADKNDLLAIIDNYRAQAIPVNQF